MHIASLPTYVLTPPKPHLLHTLHIIIYYLTPDSSTQP